MRPRVARTLALAVPVAVGVAAAGLAASAPAQAPPSADLRGDFQMSGRVTVARNVKGERVGQLVQRTWTFTPQCSQAPCASVQLVRQRATGTDTLTLQLTGDGTYSGTGRFFAPLRCAGRIYPQGQEVPFRITVHITAVNGDVASAISATYVNRSRINLTRCIGVLGRDSARYTGQLTAG
jgi:hypothetical protein